MTGPATGSIEDLLDEAAARPMVGWDFSWLDDRMSGTAPDTRYDEWVDRSIQDSPDLLDIGTGGGEWLADRPRRPQRTVATEGWEPNVEVARTRLAPLGVEVHAASGGPDNADQAIGAPLPALGTDGAMPFPDSSFELIVNRHESFIASEVRRLLRPGGLFITRQVGNGIGTAIRRELGLPPDPSPPAAWTLALAIAQLEAAWFAIEGGIEANQSTTFRDAAAFGWYVASVPWYLAGFTVTEHRNALLALQTRIEAGHRVTIPEPVFTVRARAI